MADELRARIAHLEAEVEKLRGDAEKWRAYEARKERVIKAGMLRNPMREASEPTAMTAVEQGLEFAREGLLMLADRIESAQGQPLQVDVLAAKALRAVCCNVSVPLKRAQGVAVIDAANLLAAGPTEDVEHEAGPPPQAGQLAERMGQAARDYFAELINDEGTLAFDVCSSYDIDALIAAILAAVPEVPRG